jgi:hypothetical protein
MLSYAWDVYFYNMTHENVILLNIAQIVLYPVEMFRIQIPNISQRMWLAYK